MKTAMISLALNLVLAAGAGAAEICVSPAGNDANAGTKDKPLATPTAARDAVRKLIAAGLKENITVLIAPGVYYLPQGLALESADSGSEAFSVTYAGADEAHAPVLLGGGPVTNLKPYKDKIWIGDLPQGAQPKVATENNQWLTLARDPNDGYHRTQAASGEKAFIYKGDLFGAMAGQDVSSGWVNVWPGQGWFNHVWQITALDPKTRSVGFVRTSGMGGPVAANNRFYLMNLLGLLDKSGECVIDVAAGKFYVWPGRGEAAENAYAVVTAENVLSIRGRDDAPVRNVHLRNLDLSVAAGEAVFITNAQDCSIRACRIANCWGQGVSVWQANRRITIADSEIAFTGDRGVHLRGANWKGPDISSHHVVENCHIHHVGRVVHTSAGVQIFQSGHNRVVHNHIHDSPRYGASIKGLALRSMNESDQTKARRFELLHARNNVLAYNHIHHVCLDSEDCGAMESWGPGKDNVYDHNLIHDVGTGHVLLICGIYLDDSSNYFTVTNNVVYAVNGSGHIQQIYAKGIHNTIENNIFVAGRTGSAIRSKSSGEVGFHTYRRNIIWFDQPDGPLFQFDDWDKDRITECDYNLYFNISGKLRIAGRTSYRGPFPGTWTQAYDKHSVVADPKFVDVSKRDYRLQDDSPALKLGIKSVDVRSAGLTDKFPKRLARE